MTLNVIREPFEVRIFDAPGGRWYEGCVGETFMVVDSIENRGWYVLFDDVVNGGPETRFIKHEDAAVVKPITAAEYGAMIHKAIETAVGGEGVMLVTAEELSQALADGEATHFDVTPPSDQPAVAKPTAHSFLDRAGELMGERGKQYDKCEGERSMGKTVAAFNAITGHRLTEQDGWLLMLLLKQVRQWTTPGTFHRDSAEDSVAYAALLAEALSNNKD